MPNGTELHVGFFAPQSKHIWTYVRHCSNLSIRKTTYFVRGLRLQFGEDVLRLGLGGEGSHGEDWVGMVRVGGKGVELWWG
jgi:hypothetical protein